MSETWKALLEEILRPRMIIAEVLAHNFERWGINGTTLLQSVKAQGEDYEFYPTSQQMVDVIARHMDKGTEWRRGSRGLESVYPSPEPLDP